MRELGVNIIALPATCDILGMNYALMLLFALGYGIIQSRYGKEEV